MNANLGWFTTEVKKGTGGGTIEQKSLSWFSREIRKAAKDPNYQTFSIKTDPFIGGLMFFIYDPKTKDKLPYWDRFPLVIPINLYPDGFLGLNLHYLPYYQRQLLLATLAYNYRVR